MLLIKRLKKFQEQHHLINLFVHSSNTSSIAIHPPSKDTSSDDTKKIVQNSIRLDEMKLPICGMQKTKGGGVIISTENKDDVLNSLKS